MGKKNPLILLLITILISFIDSVRQKVFFFVNFQVNDLYCFDGRDGLFMPKGTFISGGQKRYRGEKI